MRIPDFPLPRGFQWQYHFILWVQSFHNPFLNHAAVVLSYLGTESFYILLLPIVFLTVSRKHGLRLAYVFLTSMFINAWLKSVFLIARPIGVPGIRSYYMSSATGMSMPSGHAQGTMTFFTVVSHWCRQRWILWIGMLLVLLIGVSRLYLGLHWPFDVMVGWAIGLVVGRIGWTIGRWWTYRNVPFRFSLVFAVLFPALLCSFTHDSTAIEYAALLFSMGTGAVLEKQFIRSAIDNVWWKRVCAGVMGIAGIFAIQWLLKGQMSDPLWRVVSDLFIGWWTTVIAPWIFLKLDVYRMEDVLDVVN